MVKFLTAAIIIYNNKNRTEGSTDISSGTQKGGLFQSRISYWRTGSTVVRVFCFFLSLLDFISLCLLSCIVGDYRRKLVGLRPLIIIIIFSSRQKECSDWPVEEPS